MKKTSRKSTTFKALLIFIIMSVSASSIAQKITPAQSGLASVNGTKVYYEVYGEGRPIILLHGAFMTIGTNWGELIPELAKTRKVIALELQGHGHTPYSDRKLSHTTLAKDVEGVMDFLKIDSADLVGYSFGGTVGYAFAVQSPKRLRKLVIISSTYKSEGWVPAVNNAFKMMTPAVFDNTPMKTEYEKVAPDKTKWVPFVDQMFGMARLPFNIGEANIAKITAPVLLISGDNDGLDKVELMKTYQLLGGGVSADMAPMPKSHVAIVPGQSHVGLMMQTSTILGYLNDFLK